jgi:branched-chain amino acid transport system ATP-binding protein
MRNVSLLRIKGLTAGYGKKQVLYDISLDVSAGEVVAIIGPNGAGKTTLLKAVAGAIKPWSGSILLDGREVGPLGPVAMLDLGVVFIPQGRVVFDELTVAENLSIAGRRMSKARLREREEFTLDVFPELKAKYSGSAANLSGGMKQMLALARAWISRPRVLLLDEPSLGLSPDYVGDVFNKVQDISQENDTVVLVVEQKAREVGKYVDRVIALKLGKIVYDGAPSMVEDKVKMAEVFL